MSTSSISSSSSFNPLRHVHGKGEVAFDLMDKTVFIPPPSDDIRNQQDVESWDVLYYTAAEYRRIRDDNQKYIDRMNCTYDQPLYGYDPLPVNHTTTTAAGAGAADTAVTTIDEECCCFRGLEHMTMRGSRRQKMDIQRAIYAVLEEQERQRRSSTTTSQEKQEGTINPELLADIYHGFTTMNELDARRLGKKDEVAAREAYKHEQKSAPTATLQRFEHPLTGALFLVHKERDLPSSPSSSASNLSSSSVMSDTKGGDIISSDSAVDDKTPATTTPKRSSSASTVGRRRRPLLGFLKRNSACGIAR